MDNNKQDLKTRLIYDLTVKYVPRDWLRNKLTDKELIIFILRCNGANYKDISKIYNISMTRARQIYFKAERKIEYVLNNNVYKALLGLENIYINKTIKVL